MSDRGVLYIVWGDKADQPLQRSIASLKLQHPELPFHIIRATPEPGRELQQKSKMGKLTPFRSTLYLDADTVVLGNLNHAFEQAEDIGLACSIGECPWMRRYGNEEGDAVEYNTGVIFFTEKAKPVMEMWEELAPISPARSNWTDRDDLPHGSDYDDQASFARALRGRRLNPFVLPFNYNFRPAFHRSFFAPLKVWHDYTDVPQVVLDINAACEAGKRPPTHLYFINTGY